MGLLENLTARGFGQPILYLPMKDSATAHINEGTGGNFTLNGTIATSERGANQDNCVASKFDGVNDYLSRTSLAGLNNSNLFVLNFDITQPIISANKYIVNFFNGTYSYFRVFFGSNMNFLAYDSTNQLIFVTELPNYSNINMRVSISINTSMSKVLLFINGIDMTGMATTIFNNTNSINFSSTGAYAFGSVASSPSSFLNGSIGELYFDTNYIDLATNNPFWDSETNKPIPVRKAMQTLGNNPLICMPIDASNPTKNYGSGGDFTLNGGGLVGARGGSEYIARSAKFDGSTGSLSRGALTGVADTKTFSIAFSIDINISNTNMTFFGLSEATNGYRLYCRKSSTNELNFIGVNSANALVLSITTSTGGSYTAGSGSKVILASFDLANNLKGVYVNGVSNAITVTTFTNGFIDLASILYSTIGAQSDGSGTMSAYFNGNIAIGYFTTDYIDFSQEVNRLKFVDAFNMPLDLGKQIDKGIIPKPIFYLPFDDPSNLGKDASGNNNHFTVNGTITQGADVNG